MDPGRTIGWFGRVFDLVPDFFNYISGETVGNFLMFLPFGREVLYMTIIDRTIGAKNQR
ncbi:MAG: hypothetical protein J6D87_09400 [Clostridia bacterium]|nr:hypothetical protein [Clostridia bacterium]